VHVESRNLNAAQFPLKLLTGVEILSGLSADRWLLFPECRLL